MKKHFGWYYRPTTEEFQEMWKNGVFVFDTNVLLNLYRYPSDLREVFFSVLEKISDRIWIPYQVGLEFQRKKFVRIKEENNKVNKILSEINSHGINIVNYVNQLTQNNINASLKIEEIKNYVDKFEKCHKELFEAVSKSKNNLPQNNLDEPIGIRVLELFNGKVGDPPKIQDELDNLLKNADIRFENNIPPGFKDANSKDDSVFFDGDISYKSKYGDLILWNQIISYAKIQNIKSILFITDDSKSDWWDVEGSVTRGPLPALLKEMRVKGGVDLFWIYKSDQFLRFAEEYLQAHEVTEEVIEQVKDISENSEINSIEKNFYKIDKKSLLHKYRKKYEGGDFDIYSKTEIVLKNWLEKQFSEDIHINSTFPDLIAKNENGYIGFEIKYVHDAGKFFTSAHIHELSLKIVNESFRKNLIELNLIFIIERNEFVEYHPLIMDRVKYLMKHGNISSVIFGEINNDSFIFSSSIQN